MSSLPIDEVPVCPAGAQATTRLLAAWGASVAPSQRWLAERAKRIRSLRATGELAEAERYGWLSLVGLGCGMNLVAALQLAADSASGDRQSGPADLLPLPLAEPPTLTAVLVPGTDLASVDVRDQPGFELARAVLAPTGAVLSYRCRAYAPEVFAAGVRSRLTAAMETTGA